MRATTTRGRSWSRAPLQSAVFATVELLEHRQMLAVDLSAAIAGTPPTEFLPLVNNSVSVTITNNGDEPFAGSVGTTFSFVNNDNPGAGTTFLTPAHSTKQFNIQPGKFKTTTFKFPVPDTLVDGNYTVTAIVDRDNVVVESDETNNSAPLPTPVIISQPAFDIDATVNDPPANPFTIKKGKPKSFKGLVVLHNDGNVVWDETIKVDLYASTDTTLDGSDTLLTSATAGNLKISPDGTKKLKPKLKILATTPSGQYHLIAVVDSTGAVTETDESDNTVSSVGVFTVLNPGTSPPPAEGKAIDVTFGGTAIADDQPGVIPFADATQGSAGSTTVFTVRNSGNELVTLGGVVVSSGFVVEDGLPAQLAPGASDIFTVRAQTNTAGIASGTVSFSTDSPSHPTFDFPIGATVNTPTTPTLGAELTVDAVALLVNEPDQVDFTAHVFATTSAVAVSVFETDANGVEIGKVTDLFDDGSGLNGDATAGDGVFNGSTAISFTSATDRFFIAKFSDGSQQTPPVRIRGVETPSDEVVQRVMDNGDTQTFFAGADLAVGKTNAQVLDDVRARLLALPEEAVPESIRQNESMIVWTSPEGLTSGIDLAAMRKSVGAGTVDAGNPGATVTLDDLPTDSSTPRGASPTTAPLVPTTASITPLADTVDADDCKRAIILAPYAHQFEPNDNADNIADDLLQKGWTVALRRNGVSGEQNVTVEDFKSIGGQSVVLIGSHGGLMPNNDVVIDTGEKSTLLSTQQPGRHADWLAGRLLRLGGGWFSNPTWCITPSFVSRHIGSLDGAIVYVDACMSMGAPNMADAFLGRGAATYIGYDDYVAASFSVDRGNKLFFNLLNGSTVGADNEINHLTDTRGGIYPPATFSARGDLTAKLHDKCEDIGFLEVVVQYKWNQNVKDLDTGTTFLGGVVGFAAPGGNEYLTFTGDDTAVGGKETATVAIGSAFLASAWTGTINIACAAGWYTPSAGTGPAQLDVVLRNRQTGVEVASLHKPIDPGTQTSLATTSVATIVVTAVEDGEDTTATIAFG